MEPEDFRKLGYEMIDWISDYMTQVEDYPVLSRAKPGDIRDHLPENPPSAGEAMESIFADFKDIIMPGITHWNHPRFFAYFPANNSGPSILGELLSAGLGVNAMLWQTSPAATELEQLVMEWLRRMLALPDGFKGAIQDTASTSTLCALLCAREKATDFRVNKYGFQGRPEREHLRIYASSQAHSSVEKGVKIAGYGSSNLVLVAPDRDYAMDAGDLERKIQADLAAGMTPCCVSATVGTTSSTSIDPLESIGRVVRKYGLWFHVDAALAGSAAILPEKRWILNGIERADSFVFNPHKWLFTNFDCSAFFTPHPDILTRTFSILPEYLKTDFDRQITNFMDWGIQLGRRFRALKLWFVIRSYGVEGLRSKLREHLLLAQEFSKWIAESGNFEIMAPVPLQTVCFRFNPRKDQGTQLSEEELEGLNKRLMDEVNHAGRIFLTHTKLGNAFCLRLSIGQTRTKREHVEEAWNQLKNSETAKSTV